jgi:hypothetical protein
MSFATRSGSWQATSGSISQTDATTANHFRDGMQLVDKRSKTISRKIVRLGISCIDKALGGRYS